ncbi:MAG TPA: multicopper oxidase family protein, partial [Anaerolinea sp.]|nr:multicopper oxidase family protein [Anaerolinea sp.]
MQSKMQFLRLTQQGTRLVLLAAMMLALLLYPGAAKAAPLGAAVSIDLCATTGTVSLPSSPANLNVTIWGYVPGDCTGAPTATVPGGPTLDVNEGDVETVTLHNNLAEASSLLFAGISLPPDVTGAAASGGTATYTFTATNPGTYLYEAGLTPNGQHQAAMGMYGALIVRPATPGQAYDGAESAYADEAVLVLSEIDPALNNSANPAAFDMRKYNPRYGLINGLVYPNTAPIAPAAGNRVLLRHVNAGVQYHSMALLGTHQTVLAYDGKPLAFSRRMVAETIGPGQTLDAIVTVPANAPDGSRFAIYDGNLMLHNSNRAGVGGMLTFLTASAVAGGDVLGPATLNVAYAAGTLTATID